jgi:RNAse (barnase) inhibitor barstar
MAPFDFDESNVPSSPALTANLRPGIRDPHDLFEELAEQLRFPDYFGANWNALEECIRDLSWLPPGPIVLKHHDLPLAGDVASQKTYLSILSDAVEKKWTVPGQLLRDLIVLFPPETQQQIDWLVRSNERDEAGE